MQYRAVLFGFLALLMLTVKPGHAQDRDLGKYSDFTPFQEKWLITEPKQPTQDWMISYGGRIYDKWYALVDRWTPTETHPSYPKTSKKKGAETWRCKACHGWDYRGKDGAYGDPNNSNYTGIKGLRDWVGKNPRDVLPILRDETHQYSQRILPKFAAERLALFITEGQHDMTEWVDEAGKVKGDPKVGAPIFQNLCAVCHGYEGKSINFGSPSAPKYVGTYAAGNPWETFHKMRNGHAGGIMPSQRWVPMQTLADIAAYAATLPQE